MSAGTNASPDASQPGRRKPGGKLSGNRSHQGSAAHIGVRPCTLWGGAEKVDTS